MGQIEKNLSYRLGERLTREQIRSLSYCPRCHAETGEPCVGLGGIRKSNHAERYNRAYRLAIGQARAAQQQLRGAQ